MLCKAAICILTVAVLLCGCGKNTAETVNTDTEKRSITVSEGKTYSVNPEDILGTWQIVYYSDDNKTYKNYVNDISEYGFYSFYSDNTAVIQNSEDDSNVFLYNASEGTIKLFDSDTGEALDYSFGYGVTPTESGNCLIISKYTYTNRSVSYLILKEYEIE